MEARSSRFGGDQPPCDRTAQQAAGGVQQEVARADAGETGERTRGEREFTARDECAGGGAGQVLAGEGGEGKQEEVHAQAARGSVICSPGPHLQGAAAE